jgi:hypothetical protein
LETLESQSDKVRSEHALVQRTAADCVSLEVEIIQTSNTLDPNDSAAVDELARLRARLREKQNWVAIAPRVRSAISDLAKTLFEAPALIREIAERRAPLEQVPWSVFWRGRLAQIEMRQSIEDRMQLVLDVCREVVADLKTILNAKRTVRLTMDELRERVLRDPDSNLILRALSPEEIQLQAAYD